MKLLSGNYILMLTINLSASQINQIDRHISWTPDPKAIIIDAFSVKWNIGIFYSFPPLTLLEKVVVKAHWGNVKYIVAMTK